MHPPTCQRNDHGCRLEKQNLAPVDTLLSPVILFFVLRALAAVLRSDLMIPEAMAKAISKSWW
jgi:hypothetical protein